MKGNNVEIPKRQTFGSCGYDFYAPFDIELEPGRWVNINTGVKLDGDEKIGSGIIFEESKDENGQTVLTEYCHHNWFMMLVPRSSLGMKYGFRFSNTIGIIDQDYRDYIRAEMTVDKPFTIKKGERYMQGIIVPFGIVIGEEMPVKERNGGMGSTNL